MGVVRHVWEWARRSSRAERVACCAALAALAVCGALACVLAGRAPPPPPDVAPHEWNITRRMWLADPLHAASDPWPAASLPLRLVLVQHTAGVECYRFADCAATMRSLQSYYYSDYGYDLPYNFLVGNDGRVYEGRGWSGVAAHTRGYNLCSLGLGFTGDYRREGGGARASALQLNRTLRLLEGGVRAGLLHAEYLVVAACDVQATDSPGDDLYDALRRWPHFVADSQRFRNRSCEDIYAELRHRAHPPSDTARAATDAPAPAPAHR